MTDDHPALVSNSVPSTKSKNSILIHFNDINWAKLLSNHPLLCGCCNWHLIIPILLVLLWIRQITPTIAMSEFALQFIIRVMLAPYIYHLGFDKPPQGKISSSRPRCINAIFSAYADGALLLFSKLVALYLRHLNRRNNKSKLLLLRGLQVLTKQKGNGAKKTG